VGNNKVQLIQVKKEDENKSKSISTSNQSKQLIYSKGTSSQSSTVNRISKAFEILPGFEVDKTVQYPELADLTSTMTLN